MKPVSTMPSGAKIRSCKNSANGWPEMISTRQPQTSVAREYIQAEPGS